MILTRYQSLGLQVGAPCCGHKNFTDGGCLERKVPHIIHVIYHKDQFFDANSTMVLVWQSD